MQTNVIYSPEAFAALQAQLAALNAAKAQAVAALDAEIEQAQKNLADLRAKRNALQPYPTDRARARTSSPTNQPNPNRDKVLQAVRDGLTTPKEIMAATGLDNSGCWYHLTCLVNQNQISNPSRGVYLPATVAVPDAPAHNLTDDMA
jgi:hypothetical protein